MAYGTVGVMAAISMPGSPMTKLSSMNQGQSAQATELLMGMQQLPKSLDSIKQPKNEQPGWYKTQLAQRTSQSSAANNPIRSAGGKVTFTYTVKTDGSKSSLSTFSALANQTLNDSRGWANLGATFKEVPVGGQFNLVLANASRLPAYSPGCSVDWSCRVGVSVIINENRWDGATNAWNSFGGSLRDYRHMVINHEVGHWLGHGHENCSKPGAKAPVMQQQSIDMQGCKPNPWPLSSEIWSSRT